MLRLVRGSAGGDRESIDDQPQVSHYRIVCKIGRGGMAEVYRGVDVNLGKEVALKCPRSDRSLSAVDLKRFLHEGRAAARLSHPNIVQTHDAFEHEGLPWLAMEYVSGGSLRETIEREGALPPELTLKYAEQILSALETAHRKHVLHRDVKPSNILISEDGRAMLCDFGLARPYFPRDRAAEAPTQSVGLTGDGLAVGTPGYMSPEQLLGKPVDPRSDVFAFGAVLYELCSGVRAFRAGRRGDLIDSVLHHEPEAISRLNYEIPRDLERMVCKALAKRPDERYQSAGEMLADVRTLRRRIDSEAYSSEHPAGPTLKRRIPFRALGLVAAGVLVLAFCPPLTWESRLPEWEPLQITSTTGWESQPALSPSGSDVAYAAAAGGNVDVWTADPRGGDALRLTDHVARDHSPAWLPDGSALVFVSDRSGTEDIWKIDRLGGAPVRLVPDGVDPAVSPDGGRIAFARAGPAGFLRIEVASLSTPGEVTTITAGDHGLWNHRTPAWSPDGRTICYADFRDLWLVDVDGGVPRHLTDEHAADHDPVWSADGRNIYFTSGRGETTALWRIAATGGTATRITLGTGPESKPSLSHDGKRLSYTTFTGNPDIWVEDLASGERFPISGMRVDDHPAISPDLGGVVFASDRGGAFDLWRQDLADGRPVGPPRRLSVHPGGAVLPVFSPDGRWIAYGRVLDRNRDVWILPAEGGIPANVTRHPAVDVHPSWSPDGSRLAFVSNRAGSYHLWTVPVTDGAPMGDARQLTFGDDLDLFPVWSPGGERLAYIVNDGDTADVWLVGADGTTPPRRLTRGFEPHFIRWTPDGDSLLASSSQGSRNLTVWEVCPETGKVTPLSEEIVLGNAEAAGVFDLSPDGRLIAYVHEELRGDVWVLDAVHGTF